jgi:hypothetical protein
MNIVITPYDFEGTHSMVLGMQRITRKIQERKLSCETCKLSIPHRISLLTVTLAVMIPGRLSDAKWTQGLAQAEEKLGTSARH